MEVSVTKFDTLSKVLHWLSAVVILWATFSGLFLVAVKGEGEWKLLISEFNVSLTTAFIPIFCVRIVHAVRTVRPCYQGKLSAAQILCVRYVHMTMYLLAMLLFISGLLMMRSEFQVFGLITIPPLIEHTQASMFFSRVHRYVSYALTVLIILHVLAVILHQRAGKKILQRMLW
ncbi:cytochrome b [Pseudoalteromonas sp. T1lg23B]|uniref:cytochrome b n=1 Tax=Pseudoalteromonas sp. T1lg23B TaxID=2077097 RepID=UPI001319D86C|nr:cytochrome b/b6 domain-containing protein [Pseudoalteromonas sp. T1lg23B]